MDIRVPFNLLKLIVDTSCKFRGSFSVKGTDLFTWYIRFRYAITSLLQQVGNGYY